MRQWMAAAALLGIFISPAAAQMPPVEEPRSMLGGIAKSAEQLGSIGTTDGTSPIATGTQDPHRGVTTEATIGDADRDGLTQLIEAPKEVVSPPPRDGPPPTELGESPKRDGGPTAKAPADISKPAAAPSGPVAAKTLFGSAKAPAPLAARAIGFYSRGCLAGAVAVPIDGEQWQVMRLSRNRNWGHPKLVKMVQALARDAAQHDNWPGLLVGDLSQPRGGPMLTGHNSHQIGLDADIWLTPMPDRRLSAKEREDLSATSMLGKDGVLADPEVFTARHKALIRRAASYPQVERVLIHPGIKKAMCEEKGVDRRHFHKIRPYWGHHYHMHIRIACPDDSPGCREQAPTSNDDGCGREVDEWIELMRRPPKIDRGDKPKIPPKIVTVDDLPTECRTVLTIADPPQAPATPGKAVHNSR